jgi:uncharacterized protein (TIGR03435 family)
VPVNPVRPSTGRLNASLFTALDEQLGLGLISQRVSSEVLVVEPAEQLSEN